MNHDQFNILRDDLLYLVRMRRNMTGYVTSQERRLWEELRTLRREYPVHNTSSRQPKMRRNRTTWLV